MEIGNLHIKTYPFKKSPARKKDGLHQIKIRALVGKNEFGKFKVFRKFEIKVLKDDQSDLLLSNSDFNNLKHNKDCKFLILSTEVKIQQAIKKIINEKRELNSVIIFDYVYKNNVLIPTSEKEKSLINNVHVAEFFGHPVPEKLWQNFEQAVAIDGTENITDEELKNIANGVSIEYFRELEKEKVSKMTFIERYRDGFFDRNNIFELFGFAWSTNPITGEAYIADSYKSLIIQLADFRFNAKPSSNVSDFNDDWITKFLRFKIDKGYPLIHLKGYDPFTIVNYKQKFLNADRELYREKTFQSMVKHLKRYIDILQKLNLIPYNKNTDLIEAKDFLKRSDVKENFTRREHALTVEEFNRLAKTEFAAEKLNLARDMFIISVLSGGLRTQELYDNTFTVQNNRLCIYRNKTNSISENPIFGQLRDVIERHNGIPAFLDVENYRTSLKQIAKELKFDRNIIVHNTVLNSSQKAEIKKLHELFNAYFARKTFVNLLNHIGLSEEEIIEFTAHADVGTLKYYKPKLSINEKEKLLKNKLSESI